MLPVFHTHVHRNVQLDVSNNCPGIPTNSNRVEVKSLGADDTLGKVNVLAVSLLHMDRFLPMMVEDLFSQRFVSLLL